MSVSVHDIDTFSFFSLPSYRRGISEIWFPVSLPQFFSPRFAVPLRWCSGFFHLTLSELATVLLFDSFLFVVVCTGGDKFQYSWDEFTFRCERFIQALVLNNLKQVFLS